MPIADNLKIHLEVTMNGMIDAGGSNTVNTQFVFHYRRTNSALPITKAALDTIFQANHAAPIIAALSAKWNQLSNAVRVVNDAQDQQTFFTHANVGAIIGDRLASYAAVFMLFRTGLRGRSYRGGKHFGPFAESDVGDDVLNAGAIARVQTIATALALPLTDSNGNNWNLGILSRDLSKLTPNPTTIVFNDATEIRFNKRLGTMRGRKANSVY